MKVEVELGEEVFQFASQEDWVRRGARIWKYHGVTHGRGIAIDDKGRIVRSGGDFRRAERDDAYPVRVYRIDPYAGDPGPDEDTWAAGPEGGDPVD